MCRRASNNAWCTSYIYVLRYRVVLICTLLTSCSVHNVTLDHPWWLFNDKMLRRAELPLWNYIQRLQLPPVCLEDAYLSPHWSYTKFGTWASFPNGITEGQFWRRSMHGRPPATKIRCALFNILAAMDSKDPTDVNFISSTERRGLTTLEMWRSKNRNFDQITKNNKNL